MNIGEKIRELRVSKLMTQAELAGSRITRNMLSCIENGTANPSLATVQYIAGRLNVPAGFLLADEGDEIVYRKMNNLSNIKRAYVAGDLRGCRALCLSACPEPDDEIDLLLAGCDEGIAVEEFREGRLRSACRFFDEALTYADRCVYPTEAIRATIRTYFRYMERLSPTLCSDVDGGEPLSVRSDTPFSAYVEALAALDAGDLSPARDFLKNATEETALTEDIRVGLMMADGDFTRARDALTALLGAETALTRVELYSVVCRMEICCRETEDFKEAYRYANEKVALLEELLKET